VTPKEAQVAKEHWLVFDGEMTDGEGPFLYGFAPKGDTVEVVMERPYPEYDTHTRVLSLQDARMLYRALLRDGACKASVPREPTRTAYRSAVREAAAYNDAYVLAKAGGHRERL
jgi:hypothetical protein